MMPVGAPMGFYVKRYKPQRTIHTFVNNVLDSFSRPRYGFTPSAVITVAKRFPDVSFYQQDINWDVMRSVTDTVIVRAGQNVWADPYFLANYAAAKARQMFRGIYYFYDDRASPKAQADLLRGLIGSDLPEMEIWVDWERNYGGLYAGLKNVVAMMQLLEQYFPIVRVGLYSGYYFFRDNTNAITNASQYAYLKTHPLWLAWYTSNPALVLVPSPWTRLDLWQEGTPSVGSRYGVKTTEIDMNVFNGSENEFYALYGDHIPPTNGENMIYSGTVTTPALNVRSSADSSSTANIIDKLVSGDKVKASQVVAGWWKLIEKNGQPFTGYSYEGDTKGYIRTDSVVPDPPARTMVANVVVSVTDETGTYEGTAANVALTKK